MNLTLIRPDRLFFSTLPDEVTGRHWVSDVDDRGQARNLACIEAKDGRWELMLASKADLAEERVTLSPEGDLLPLALDGAVEALLLIENPALAGRDFRKVGFVSDARISIGSDLESDLLVASRLFDSTQAVLGYQGERFTVTDVSPNGNAYVNGLAIPKGVVVPLGFGDTVFILGLTVIIGKRFIAFNNPGWTVSLKPSRGHVGYRPQQYTPPDDAAEDVIGADPDFFFRSPRIRRDIVPRTISVEGPPSMAKQEETPTILRVGPAICMALGSAMMGIYMISTAIGSNNIARAVPMMGMMLVMILGAVLWPNLTRRYERKKAEAAESVRRATYAAYLDKIRTAIAEDTAHERQVLEENRIPLSECLRRVGQMDRRIFERTPIQPDFLELCIGRGDAELMTQLAFPADKLSLEEDLLKDLLDELERRDRFVEDVPLSICLQDDFISGVVARPSDYYPFMRGLIAQLVALHAPEEVKLAFIGDPGAEGEWEFVKALPHIFDIGSTFRFLATDQGGAAEVSLRLERELSARLDSSRPEKVGDYGTYYVVFVANQGLAKTTDIIGSLAKQRANMGFSVITFADALRHLPKECSRIIELDGLDGVAYDPKDSSGKRTRFKSDISLGADVARRFAEALSGIEVDDAASSSSLPSSLGFLEMFEVGKVEHLNVSSRWAESNPMRSLAAPIGVDPQGLLLMLDAHEDAHGPHGLFAGMTGSGKSETIITYILSLAVHYRPDEVSFVLIDYKGGGLAGAFDNQRARLPHLAGTITNLDGPAIARSLISIQSELKRRQAVFNQARDLTSAGNVDIYKYQELYRKGVVSEPCPHLFIIADEFAELKTQEPEFMDQLISAARIGRSLGVHLLLATQKPSGVVNDQIWSNARFKVCLKVADAADSSEMLKRPDAAELVDAGRFYLQVGYNEYFALAQSGYSGINYRPSERFERKVDDSVVLVSATGRPVASAAPPKPQAADGKVPEAVAVLDHLVKVAEDAGLSAPRLWLDPIPEDLSLTSLAERQPEASEELSRYTLSPVVGEYDDPYNQSQGVLRLDFSEAGNALVYGAAGTGKSAFLASMLMSLIRSHPPEAVNAYILDFGSETLGAFDAAPHVGDIVFVGDDERVGNLMLMLESEIEERRKLLSRFGGSLELYNKSPANSVSPLPFIVVAINNFDVFSDVYIRHVDALTQLTRDGTRYGIYFVMTCARAGAVNFRMQPNFKQKLTMQLNNRDEYVNVLGSVRDIVIPTAYGRGLAIRDRVMEFQTAFIDAIEGANEFEAITAALTVADFGPGIAKARAIPSLPDYVTVEMLVSEPVKREAVPIGLSRNSFEVETHDFKRAPGLFIMGDDEEGQMRFIEAFTMTLCMIGGSRVYVMDPDELLDMSRLQVRAGLTIVSDRKPINSFITTNTGAGSSLGVDDYIMVVSLRSFIECLDEDAKASFDAFVRKGAYKDIGGLTVTGIPSRLSVFTSDGWYRELRSLSNCVWASGSISNQDAVKMNRLVASDFKDTLPESHAWFVKRGNVVLVKYAMLDTHYDEA